MKTFEHLIWLIVLIICFVFFIFMWINNLELQRKAENLELKVYTLRNANWQKDKENALLKRDLLDFGKLPPITSTKSYKQSKFKNN